MAMTACYPNYDMSSLSNSQTMSHHHHHHHASTMQQQQQPQSSRSASLLAATQQSPQTQQPPQKDYSIPLHVDCSVEYELPNQAKPPVGGRVEPLLMIHPCYFRKMESQRRSPFINNMPNSTTCSSAVSSSTTSRSTQNSQSQNMRHMNMNPHQNLQQQIDEYVQRQMVHISQQAQYPSIGQPQQQQPQSSQYNLPTQQMHSNSSSNNNWDNHNYNNPNSATATAMLGKVNIPNQNAYKKSGSKRHLSVATCANSYSTTGHYEGALPNGMTTRWDEKTVMATIPREYSESIQHHQQQKQSAVTTACNVAAANMYRGNNTSQQQQQAAVLMSGGATTKRDRDPMLSGGCIYSNSNNSNLTTDINSLVSSAASGLWPIQKSPMAAIPNNNYHQAGPDSIPNNNHHSSNSNSNKTTSNGGMTHRHQPPPLTSTVIHHSHYAQQQPSQQRSIHHSDKVNNNNNNSSSSNNNNNVITVKYRQYRNSHRMHPYMMSNMTAPTANGNISALSGVSYFPQLANGPFPQIQQVSCYNV